MEINKSSWMFYDKAQYIRLWRHIPKGDNKEHLPIVHITPNRHGAMFVVMPTKANASFDIVLLCVDSGLLVEANPKWVEGNFRCVNE